MPNEELLEQMPHSTKSASTQIEATFAGGFEQIDVRQESRRSGITLRAVIVGFLIILFIAIAEPYNAWFKGSTYLIGNHFPSIVIFMLLILILLVNPLLKLARPGSQFAPSELVVVFMLTYGICSIPGSGLIRYWLTLLTGGFFFTSEHPDWADKIFNQVHLRDWVFPSTDPDSLVIQKFWRGFGENQDVPWETWREIISAWTWPFLAWGALFALIFLCMWCLASLLRKQWVENEKLSFPLAQVALEIMRPPEKGKLVNNLFRNKLLWIGTGIVVLGYGLQVLNKFVPSVPVIPIERGLDQLFANAPWNAAGGPLQKVRFYFTGIGIAYFITTRCSFSLWFFVVVVALVPVAGAQFGYPVDGGIWQFQFIGAMIVLIGTLAWVSRAHIRTIFLSVVGRHKEPKGKEYMSYRAAGMVFLLSFAGAVAWLTLAGMSWYFALLVLGVLFTIFLTMARIVAETGIFFVQTAGLDTGAMSATQYFSAPPVAKDNYLLGSILHTQFWDVRESHLPFAVNALRVADGTKRIKRRGWLIPLLMLGMLLAFAASASTYGYVAYTHGALAFKDGHGTKRAIVDQTYD
ncbi:MAG: hypothetical protein QGD94_00400, partial [Planctomycetia bacterium]|nr:hypothetical protein [Planctomycetia bacterium]